MVILPAEPNKTMVLRAQQRPTFSIAPNFLAATVLDVNKNLLTGVSVTSASGFDYLAGVTLTAVPVPAAFPLLAGGLGLMGLLGWRRKRRAAAVA